ncbi:hypothetical protein DPM19_18155 [Actinomadura craniellae]|uniref:Uncharacterized protein n=1 Tax=Actinomadura craniellae TaxID=2231787 RepID=A0A365H3M9_9ACTN|nr:hypothetical protein [Actinomadura craniellae]RAY13602.1 hypothetical protein DPM19_18155 [Actinomadura craniellae]
MNPAQRDDAWLKAATPAQIAQAHDAGELVALMGGHVPDIPAEGQLTHEHVTQMTPAQITQALHAGRLTDVLTTAPSPPPRVTAPPGQLTDSAVSGMRPDEVTEAMAAGKLDFLMGRVPGVPYVETPRSGEF